MIEGWIRFIVHGDVIILPKSAENCQWQQGIHRHQPHDFLFGFQGYGLKENDL